MLTANKQMLVVFLVFLFVLLAGGAAVFLLASPEPSPATPAVEGAPGIGDSYYPTLGNGGYDVQNYAIMMEVDPSTNNVNSSTTITANATESLSSFNLDFHGLTVDSIQVNGMDADYSRNGDELTITPAAPLEANKPFTTIVQYHGSPETISSAGLPGMGWSHGDSGVINVWGEPEAASTWFPSNNHPRDKATYRFEITVPDPWMVAATGTLKETRPNEGKTTFIWEMDKPMATYLASINIDQYDLDTRNGPDETKIRNYFPKDFPESSRSDFAALPTMIEFFVNYFGPYPFSNYGVVIAGEDGLCQTSQIALETQTLSIHCPSEAMTSEWVTTHELAHMWFGDSVSLENWQDIWLKEGFATYASWMWASKNDPGTLAGIAQEARSHFFDTEVSVAQPSPDNLYSGESYTGGALVLYALKQEVGEETFFKILQTYAERYRYGNAGTDDFIAVAEQVSGRDLTPFFDAWLFAESLPQLPE
jgi:aminopeptidase N